MKKTRGSTTSPSPRPVNHSFRERETDMQSIACAPAHSNSVPGSRIPPVLPSERSLSPPIESQGDGFERPSAARLLGGVALKLDTRILTGNPFALPAPEHVPYSEKSVYSGRPINYPVYEKSVHFRAKVQEFSGGGYEAVITSVNMQRHSDMAAMHLVRGPRLERKGDKESIEKSMRRSKRSVRLKCKEMGADHLVTFTTRDTTTRDILKARWAKFTDNVAYHLDRKFQYVCVCEPHPTNPDHLHLHVAIRGRLSAREMVIFRRCWYVALGGTGKERGSAAPGGFNIRHIRVRGGVHRRADRIASYISKYITKDVSDEFNKKRYWCSRIDLMEARSYWLKANTVEEALIEFCLQFDFEPDTKNGDFFKARNIDLVWLRLVPDDVPDKVSCPF